MHKRLQCHTQRLLVLCQAARLPPRSVERLLHVSAFVASTYNTMKRTDKPFKNLQNATYELVYPEKGLRMIMEKVRNSSLLGLQSQACKWAKYLSAGRAWGHRRTLLPTLNCQRRGCIR